MRFPVACFSGHMFLFDGNFNITKVHQVGNYILNYVYLVLVLFSFLPALVCLVALLQKKNVHFCVIRISE